MSKRNPPWSAPPHEEDGPATMVESVKGAKLLKMLEEFQDRKTESLLLYEPLKIHEKFHASKAKERIVRGGNRCLAGWSNIWDPAAHEWRRLDQIDTSFTVLAKHPATGSIVEAAAEKPFLKGFGTVYRVRFTNGLSIDTTLEHRLLAADGRWVSVMDAWRGQIKLVNSLAEAAAGTCPDHEVECQGGASHPGRHSAKSPVACRSLLPTSLPDSTSAQPVPDPTGSSCASQQPECSLDLCRSKKGTFQTGCREDGRRSSRTAPDYPDDCPPDHRSCDEPLPSATDTCPGSAPSPGDARERSQMPSHTDAAASAAGCTRRDLGGDLLATRDALLHSSVHDGGGPLRRPQVASAPSVRRSLAPLRLLPPSSPPFRTYEEELFDSSEFLASHPTCFATSDDEPSVLIAGVEHLGLHAIWDFEVRQVGNYLHGGVFSANSGKTTPTMVELARAVTNQDPYHKFPAKDGLVFLVGAKLQHLADVFYRKLFMKGAIRLVKDEETGQLRAWRPWIDGYEQSQLILSPPLIPSRFVKEMVFEHRARKQITYVSLTTGWEIMLFSSEADPPVGTDIDIAIIDEDVKNAEWIGEMQARILDRNGKFIWSTLPYSKNTLLRDICERCQDEMAENPESPRAEEFVLRMRDNPYISPQAKEDAQRQWAEAGYTLEQRDLGEFATNHYLVWPDFDIRTHGLDLSKPDKLGDIDEREVPAIFPSRTIPDDWCRYMIVDPGRQVLAVLFAVLPPPRWKIDMVLIEGELYIRNATAEMFGQAVARYLEHKSLMASIIDEHGSRIHDMGGGIRVAEQYSRALKKYEVKAQNTGYNFISGCDDIEAREQAVASWLAIRPNGTTKLRILLGRCPQFEREISRFTRQMDAKGNIKDQGDYRRDAHLMANLGYLAAYDPKWRRPARSIMHDDRAKREKAALERVNKNKPKDNSGGVILAPIGNPRRTR